LPFIPTSKKDALSDIIPFIVSPITAIPTAVYSATAYVTQDYPFGKPDHAANIRNVIGWTTIASAVYGWNLWMSPHNAVWVSGGSAMKAAGHMAMTSSWAAPSAGFTILLAIPVGLYAANRAVIESAPVEQQQSLWQVFSQGLTGTGPGVGGWTP
jgi:hypothetical protein